MYNLYKTKESLESLSLCCSLRRSAAATPYIVAEGFLNVHYVSYILCIHRYLILSEFTPNVAADGNFASYSNRTSLIIVHKNLNFPTLIKGNRVMNEWVYHK